MSRKEELQKAGSLIQMREFDKAREILTQMKADPLAKKWLARLDEIAPVAIAPKRQVTRTMPVKKSNLFQRIVRVVSLIVIGLFLTSAILYAFTPEGGRMYKDLLGISCEAKTRKWWNNDAKPIVVQYLDTSETAVSTSRGSLSPIVLELQSIRRDFQATEAPDCASDIHFEVDRGMYNSLLGFNEFLSGSDSPFSFTLATQNFYEAYRQLFDMTIFADTRMSDTSIFIWGGSPPQDS